MFIVFYILILNVIQRSSVNSIRIENDYQDNRNQKRKITISELQDQIDLTLNENEDVFQNSTNTKPDLKSNVFDKMLSNEMLSLKEQFHRKDATYSSGVQISTQSNLHKPTLEVKQRWLQLASFSRDVGENNRQNEKPIHIEDKKPQDTDKKPTKARKKHKTKVDVRLKDIKIGKKVLGLRSVNDNQNQESHHINSGSTKKACTCFKANPSSSCHKLASPHSCTRNSDSKSESSAADGFPYTVSSIFIPAVPYYVDHVPHIAPPMLGPNSEGVENARVGPNSAEMQGQMGQYPQQPQPMMPPAMPPMMQPPMVPPPMVPPPMVHPPMGHPPMFPPPMVPPPMAPPNQYYPPAVVIGVKVPSPTPSDDDDDSSETDDESLYYDDKNSDDSESEDQKKDTDNQLVDDIVYDLKTKYKTTIKKCCCSADSTRISNVISWMFFILFYLRI